MADLSVNIGELQMKNPVMTASGTFGYGEEFSDFIDIARIGGIIVKGTTLHKREGNPYPRMAETPSGMLNAVGLQNKGVDYFVEHIYPRIKDIQTNMIVNVSGSAIEDYVKTAEIINELDKIPAIELNISCPNVKQGGMAFGVSAKGAVPTPPPTNKSLSEASRGIVYAFPSGSTTFIVSPGLTSAKRLVPSPTSWIRNQTSFRCLSTKLIEMGRRKNVVGEPSTRSSANCPGNISGSND